MKNSLKNFFAYTTLIIFLSQSIMTPVMAMSPEDFEEKSLKVWMLSTAENLDFEEFEARRLSYLLDGSNPTHTEESFHNFLIEEVRGSDNWEDPFKTLLYIARCMGKKEAKEEAQRDLINFFDFFQSNIDKFNESFRPFANRMMTFLGCQVTSDKAKRTRLLMEAVDRGDLGHGVFLLEALSRMKWDTIPEPDAYIQGVIDRMPDSPYFTPYKDIIKVRGLMKKTKSRYLNDAERAQLTDDLRRSFEELCEYGIAQRPGYHVIGLAVNSLKPQHLHMLIWNEQEPNGINFDLFRDALINTTSPATLERIADDFLDFSVHRLTHVPVDPIRPLYNFMKSLFAHLGLGDSFIIKLAKHQTRYTLQQPGLFDIDPDYLRGGLRRMDTLEARVLKSRLNMSEEDKGPLFTEIQTMDPSSEKYELLALLVETSFGRPTRADFDHYLTLVQELRENIPLSEKGSRIVTSIMSGPYYDHEDPLNLTGDQWATLLEEALQIPLVRETDGYYIGSLFNHLFLDIYQNINPDRLTSDQDDAVITGLRHFMRVSPHDRLPYSERLEAFFSVLDWDFSTFEPMNSHMGWYHGGSTKYLEDLLNRQLARRAQDAAVEAGDVSGSADAQGPAIAVAEDVAERAVSPSLLSLPDEVLPNILSFLSREDGLQRLCTVNKRFLFLLRQSLYALEINGRTIMPILNRDIFYLFSNLHTLRIRTLEDLTPFPPFPLSLTVLDMEGVTMQRPGNRRLPSSVVPRLLDSVGRGLNNKRTLRDHALQEPILFSLTMPRNLWNAMPRGEASSLSRLKLTQDVALPMPAAAAAAAPAPQEQEPQPRVMKIPALDHLDLSSLPGDQIVDILNGFKDTDAPLHSLVLPEGALSIEAIRRHDRLDTIEGLEIIPTPANQPFAAAIALTQANLQNLMVNAPALRRLTIGWTGGLTAENVLQTLQTSRLTELDIRHVVTQNHQPFTAPVMLPANLSSLSIHLPDYPDMRILDQLLRESQVRVLRVRSQAQVYAAPFSNNIPSGIEDLLTTPLDTLYLDILPMRGQIDAVTLARVLAWEGATVREVVFPRGYRYFYFIQDILRTIQSVDGQNNGVRIRME